MRHMRSLAFIVAIIFILVGCAGNSSGGDQTGYETTKKMVVDILKTDEGKKAITQVLTDQKMKQQIVLDSEVVKKSIEETVSSDKGKKFWKELFSNPEFTKTFAQSMTEQQKKVMKELMNDSKFQKSMLELMKNPEMEKQMSSVMTSQKFREHLEKTIQETMNTPIFKAKMSEIVLKAAEEMKSSGGEQGEQSKDGQEKSQGGKQSEGKKEEGGQGEDSGQGESS
ncbi:spore germination lipoprotein GerD [Pontibacillus sp. HMF3514]|uniref:spore germination lipoprotein GerD n=1 Tax=Pontibacillus sp. HMF3514 TaxID=2692425 RepID=UPI00131F7A50|nr:spore germination lipoprotein GerD [Pontibacillus sp. HMF3514]QHE50727.1 spore gernimation protein GerD [Pontibacillus sp. HMF3514]